MYTDAFRLTEGGNRQVLASAREERVKTVVSRQSRCYIACMADFLVVVTIVAFFALCVAFVYGCDRVIGPDEET